MKNTGKQLIEVICNIGTNKFLDSFFCLIKCKLFYKNPRKCSGSKDLLIGFILDDLKNIQRNVEVFLACFLNVFNHIPADLYLLKVNNRNIRKMCKICTKLRKEEKILGVIIDNKLRFKSHIKNLCKKSSQKIWALSCLIND